jgi:superfamily II DNA/RNA helicase
VGRCGRFGDFGVNVNLISQEEELEVIKKLEKFYKMEI